MKVRAILEHPEIADNFDFFNDYRDTIYWLKSLPKSEQRDTAIERLTQRGQEAIDRGERFIRGFG